MEGRAPQAGHNQVSEVLLPSEPCSAVQLHGFCDASEAAMAAVVYIRTSYSDEPPICRLVTSKTRVAPLKVLSIPRLELAGASLLAKVLTSTREALGIPLSSVHACSDSSIVLAWLDGAPRRYRTFIGNRILVSTQPFLLVLGNMFLHSRTRLIVPPGG